MAIVDSKHDDDVRDHDVTKEHHDAAMTGRPAILFPATGKDNDGLIFQMGKDGPRVIEAADWAQMPAYAEWGFDPPQTVLEFTVAYMRRGTPEHKVMEVGVGKADRETLYNGLRRLQRVHGDMLDTKTAREEMTAAAKVLLDDPRLRGTFQSGPPAKVAEWFYGGFFNRELQGARLVLWLTKQNQFLPAILCPSMKAAMYALAAFDGLVACRNCGEVFTTEGRRPDKSKSSVYCTAACGLRYRAKTYRVRKKTGLVKPRPQRKKSKNKTPRRS